MKTNLNLEVSHADFLDMLQDYDEVIDYSAFRLVDVSYNPKSKRITFYLTSETDS